MDLDSGYGDLTLGSAQLEEVKSLRILGAIFDFKLTFETYLRETHGTRSLGAVRWTGKLFDCSCALKSCFNAYVLSNLEYCAHMLMSSFEFAG